MAIGPILREARHQKQLTTSQVAEMTRMKVQIVDDLENDDFHRIAATIYGKGFIKLYAELVDLDPEPLIADYMEQAGAPQAPKLPKKKQSQTPPMATTPQGDEVEGIAAAIETEQQESASPDDLFTYAAQKPKQTRKSAVAVTTSAPAPAAAPAASSQIEKWQSKARDIAHQTRAAVTRAIESIVKKFTESGEHDKWIQRGLITLGIIVALLILIPLVRIIITPREAPPLPDDELILFVPPPEPYFE